MPKKIDILGVKIDNLTTEELKENIINFATQRGQKTILYVNTNSMNLTKRNDEFKGRLNFADILHSDGWGIVWASRCIGMPLKEVIVTTDFFTDFCAELSDKKISLYFLGAQPDVAKQAKEELTRRISSIRVSGEHPGHFAEQDSDRIIEQINSCRPDILVVGMGSPKQEEWICLNRSRLEVPLCWAVGGLFDFLSGKIKRAPLWMRNFHLEWLFRLFFEPKRLWRRYLIENWIFVYRVLKFKLCFSFGSLKRVSL